jgi:hypothetical protein
MENLRRYGVSPLIVGSLVLLLFEVQVRSGKVEQIRRPHAKHDAKIGFFLEFVARNTKKIKKRH